MPPSRALGKTTVCSSCGSSSTEQRGGGLMARTTIKQLKKRRVAKVTASERASFDETYAAAALAIRVGEQIRDARDAAGLSQRDLAERMSTSQAAIARL